MLTKDEIRLLITIIVDGRTDTPDGDVFEGNIFDGDIFEGAPVHTIYHKLLKMLES